MGTIVKASERKRKRANGRESQPSTRGLHGRDIFFGFFRYKNEMNYKVNVPLEAPLFLIHDSKENKKL